MEFNPDQCKELGLKKGYEASIARAKRALRDLDKHGVGIFASGSLSFRPAKALDPRFQIDSMSSGIANDGGDGGDNLPEYDDLAAKVEELGYYDNDDPDPTNEGNDLLEFASTHGVDHPDGS